jgi:serine/threonine protein kinase
MNLINNKYQLIQKIGNGKFGVVYKGKNIKTQQYVAIKTEKKNQEINTLKYETTILNYLYGKGCRDIPFVLYYGLYNDYTCLVMTYFDKPLTDYLEGLKEQTMKINKIMVRMIEILENVHSYYVIHRDLKPDNFMILNNEVYLLDFGMATFYINENNCHIECKDNREYIIGTPKYISINIHNGIDPSRRDDMISIGYIYLYMYHTTLPWSDNKVNSNSNNISSYSPMHILHENNIHRKTCKEWDNIVKYKDFICNESIQKYLKYCYNLVYTETPNYSILRELFTNN